MKKISIWHCRVARVVCRYELPSPYNRVAVSFVKNQTLWETVWTGTFSYMETYVLWPGIIGVLAFFFWRCKGFLKTQQTCCMACSSCSVAVVAVAAAVLACSIDFSSVCRRRPNADELAGEYLKFKNNLHGHVTRSRVVGMFIAKIKMAAIKNRILQVSYETDLRIYVYKYTQYNVSVQFWILCVWRLCFAGRGGQSPYRKYISID